MDKNNENITSRIYGVFSTIKIGKVGACQTQKKSTHKLLYFAEEQNDGTISIQPINKNFVPLGPKSIVPKEEFLQNFVPEPEIYINKVYPAMKNSRRLLQEQKGIEKTRNIIAMNMSLKEHLELTKKILGQQPLNSDLSIWIGEI